MKTRKRLLLVFTVCMIIVTAVAALAACSDNNAPIVTNGDFESGASIAESWTINESSNVTLRPSGSDDATVNNGTKYSASITASSSWSYISQEVKLSNNAYYKLSVRVRIQDLTPVETGSDEDKKEIGFVVGFKEDNNFEGLNVTSSTIKNYGSTAGKRWAECYVYFQSKSSTTFNLFVGIGNSAASPSGTVYFDDISITKQDSSVTDSPFYVGYLKDGGTYSMAGAGSYVYVVLLAVFTMFAAYMMITLIRYAMAKDATDPLYNADSPSSAPDAALPESSATPVSGGSKSASLNKILTSPLALFTYAMLAAFVVRFIVAVTTYGFGKISSDYYTFYSNVNADGWGKAYATIPGIPSLSAYVIWLFARIATMLGVEGNTIAMAITLRVPTVLADIIVCYLIYSFASTVCSLRVSACYAAAYAVMPVFFTESALFGSYMSLAMPFVVAMVAVMMSSLRYKAVWSGVLYTLALLFSNWMLLLLPMIIIFQIGCVVKAQSDRNRIIASVAVQAVISFLAVYLIALPMTLPYYAEKKYFEVFNQMYAWFKQNTFMSNDAFNMYAMFGQVNSGITSTALEVCTWLFAVTMAVVSAVNYFANGKSTTDLILISGISVILFAALGAGVTVEVMSLGLILLFAYIILVPDVRLMAGFGVLAFTHFLNIAQLVGRGGFIGSSGDMEYLMFPAKSAFVIVFSLVTVLAAFYLVYVTLDICYYNREKLATPLKRKLGAQMLSDIKFDWVKELVNKKK